MVLRERVVMFLFLKQALAMLGLRMSAAVLLGLCAVNEPVLRPCHEGVPVLHLPPALAFGELNTAAALRSSCKGYRYASRKYESRRVGCCTFLPVPEVDNGGVEEIITVTRMGADILWAVADSTQKLTSLGQVNEHTSWDAPGLQKFQVSGDLLSSV